MAQFYADLYSERVPNSPVMDKVTAVISDLNKVETITSFSPDNRATRPSVECDKFTNLEEIGALVKALSPKTSSGGDKVPNLIIKKLPLKFLLIFTKLANHCINNSYSQRNQE